MIFDIHRKSLTIVVGMCALAGDVDHTVVFGVWSATLTLPDYGSAARYPGTIARAKKQTEHLPELHHLWLELALRHTKRSGSFGVAIFRFALLVPAAKI